MKDHALFYTWCISVINISLLGVWATTHLIFPHYYPVMAKQVYRSLQLNICKASSTVLMMLDEHCATTKNKFGTDFDTEGHIPVERMLLLRRTLTSMDWRMRIAMIWGLLYMAAWWMRDSPTSSCLPRRDAGHLRHSVENMATNPRCAAAFRPLGKFWRQNNEKLLLLPNNKLESLAINQMMKDLSH